MLQAFVITFREGLEAFLIVAISLAFLRKSGSRHLVPAVHWGIAVSIARERRRRLFPARLQSAPPEGILAILAAVLGRLAHRAHVATRTEESSLRSRGASRPRPRRSGRRRCSGCFSSRS